MKKIHLIIGVLNGLLNYTDKNWKVLVDKLNELEGNLLSSILSNPSITDEEAAESLFNTDFKDLNYQRYRNSLAEKLLKEVLLFNPSKRSYSTFQRAQYKCEQLYTVLKMLRGTEYTEFAKMVALPLIRRARKYHFTEIRVGTNEYLVYYYSFIEPNSSQVKQYYKDLVLSTEMRQAELFAESNYNVLASRIILGSLKKSVIIELARETKSRLESFESKGENSHKFYHQYYSFCVLAYELQGDFKSALEYARKGYNYVQNLNFVHKKAKGLFLNRLTNCYLVLGYFTEARQTIIESLKIQKEGENNWFRAQWLLIQIELSQRKYSEAASIYAMVVGNKSFQNQAENRQYQYKNSGAMLHYLYESGRIADFPVFDEKGLYEQIKNPIDFDENRSSYNIPSLIIQLMFHLRNSNLKGVNEAILELDRYSSQKLRTKNPKYRSNAFIKLLKCIPAGHYKPISIKKRSDKIFQQLSNVEFKISDEKAIVEIIPYEDLWEIIIEDLGMLQKIRSTRIKATRNW